MMAHWLQGESKGRGSGGDNVMECHEIFLRRVHFLNSDNCVISGSCALRQASYMP